MKNKTLLPDITKDNQATLDLDILQNLTNKMLLPSNGHTYLLIRWLEYTREVSIYNKDYNGTIGKFALGFLASKALE